MKAACIEDDETVVDEINRLKCHSIKNLARICRRRNFYHNIISNTGKNAHFR